MKHKRKLKPSRILFLVLVFIGIPSLLFFLFRPVSNTQNMPEDTPQTTDLADLLAYAKEPLGQVMYIWGGGWNEEDTGAGTESRHLGLSPAWKTFAGAQDATYDFNDHLYEIHHGLDCSGYIGWLLYNTFETKDSQPGYVRLSQEIGPFLEEKGYGTMIAASDIQNYEPGDLLANTEHIFMVLGTYEDGSLLIIHASPPGVRICGTPNAQGETRSQAEVNAENIMQTYYPDWSAKYPTCSTDFSYLTAYDQFRWNPDKLPDAQGFRKKTADAVISYLFSSEN